MDLVAGRVLADERRPIRHVDWLLLATVVVLSAIGLVLVYSATNQTLRQDGLDPFARVNKQAFTMGMGLVVLLVVSAIDYRFLKVYAGFVYAVTMVLLTLLLVPGLASPTGAYFDIPGVALLQISPAEFAKIGVIVMAAAILAAVRTQEPALRDVLRVVVVGGVAILLMLANVEIGSAIVIVAVVFGVLIVAGARARHLIALAIGGVLLIAAAFQLHVVREYQLDRMRAFLDPQGVSEDVRYNLDQSLIAVGSGGLTGKGYLHGSQTNLDYVPEQHTDFIFTVAAEEFGFVGAAFVLSLFALLLWRAIRIAWLAKDPFGTYLAAGVASMFAIQMFVNVGMVIGIMPITGIPLPFLSYGGTSIIVTFAAVGLLESVHMRRFT